ncbi:MAG: YggT family protein [Candidatus Wallbacteria bacterium]|nr:YggT family protein [Candidatus Wallbacteria bacterium]
MERLIVAVFISFQVLIGIRVVLSWLGQERGNSFSDFVHDFTEPLLSRLRIVLPMNGMGIDLSPVIAFFLLNLLMEVVINLLRMG